MPECENLSDILTVNTKKISDKHQSPDLRLQPESPVWHSPDALFWKIFSLFYRFCVTVPQIKQRTCMKVSLYYMFSDRQMPNQSSPLSAEPSVIPQIQSRITSEKIKIIQLIQKSGLQQYGMEGPFSNKKSHKDGQNFFYYLSATIYGKKIYRTKVWLRSAKTNW